MVGGDSKVVLRCCEKFFHRHICAKYVPQDVRVNVSGLSESHNAAVVLGHRDLGTIPGGNGQRRATGVGVESLSVRGIKHPSLREDRLETRTIVRKLLVT
jgi:hypothetical protein